MTYVKDEYYVPTGKFLIDRCFNEFCIEGIINDGFYCVFNHLKEDGTFEDGWGGCCLMFDGNGCTCRKECQRDSQIKTTSLYHIEDNKLIKNNQEI